MIRIFLVIICLVCSLSVQAQTHGVIADMENHTPIRNVQIYSDTGKNAMTDYAGRFNIAFIFGSLTLSHPQYLRRTVTKEMLCDTIFLLPKMTNLQEVIIYGKKPRTDIFQKKIREETRNSAPPSRGISFDFGALFDHSVRHASPEERAKNKKILDNY